MNFRRATIEDLDMLVATRIEVLRVANRLDASIDMSEVEQQSRDHKLDLLLDWCKDVLNRTSGYK